MFVDLFERLLHIIFLFIDCFYGVVFLRNLSLKFLDLAVQLLLVLVGLLELLLLRLQFFGLFSKVLREPQHVVFDGLQHHFLGFGLVVQKDHLRILNVLLVLFLLLEFLLQLV